MPGRDDAAAFSCGVARTPRQARGQRRVDGILDAAEAVIAECGVTDASVQEIARRAGASVGSMYHFFPTKDAIVAALSDRYTVGLEHVAVSIAQGTAATARAPLGEFVDALVGPFAGFLAASPAYLLLPRAKTMKSAFCTTLERALEMRFPDAGVEDWALRSSLLHALGESVVTLLAQARVDERDRLFGEFKRAVVAYLASYERAGCAA